MAGPGAGSCSSPWRPPEGDLMPASVDASPRPSTAAEPHLSPLEQIQRAEALVAGKLAAAHEARQAALADARRNAATLLDEARELGLQDGQVEYDRLLRDAMTSADAVVARADDRARALRLIVEPEQDSLARAALAVVLAGDGGGFDT